MNETKKTFLVGFSGGADSTAALLLLLEKCDGKVVAVHFNHHLRGAESDAEAENAAHFAAERGVEFRLIDLDIAPGSNLEARARQARLEQWKQLVTEYENPIVVTGHHKDDCIENMFLRMGRGSNVSGLTGLQSYSEVEGVKFFRPLINFSRKEIEEFLLQHNVTIWAVDSSNLSCDYTRNALRNKILPELYQLFPGGRKAIEQTLSNLAYDAAFIDSEAVSRYQHAANRYEIAFWHGQPRALVVRMLKMLCREFFPGDQPLSSGAVERFDAMVREKTSGICVLDDTRKLYFAGGRIFPLIETGDFEVEWDFCEQKFAALPDGWILGCEVVDAMPGKCRKDEAFFNLDLLPPVLTVATAASGEKMVPFGKRNPVLLKKLRVDAKVPALMDPPVLKAGNKIIWFPGIRHSDAAPVTEKCRIIRFFVEKDGFLAWKNL